MAVGSFSASPAKLTDGEVGGLEQVSNHPEVAVAPTDGEEALGRGQGIGFTKYCHQCHHKTAGIFPACKKQTKGKFCNIKYCEKCLWNRYKEKVEEVSILETWHCPKCRGSCNCCTCRKRQGLNPSGKVATAEASGSSAPELLNSNVDSLQQLSVHSKDDINSENPAIALLEGKTKGVSSTFKRKRAKGSIPEVVLPQGTEITEIAGIDFHPEDISHSLQFLEFCAYFKKCLALKEGEGESILREIASGGRACQRTMSLTVRFNKQLLSYLPEDLEEKRSPVTPRAGKNSWLHHLRRLATRSSFLPQNLDLEQLCAEDGYDNLNFSQKLRLLNFLCDESLNTIKLRRCMDKKLKKEQGKVLAKKQEKLKIDDVLANNADHEAAETKVEAAIGEMSKLKGIVPSVKQGLNDFRIKPIRLGVDGRICWRLNFCGDASNLFIEEVGSSDGRIEKWFTYNVEEEKEMERYLIFARTWEKSRKVVVHDLTNKAREDEETRKVFVDNLTNNTEEDEETRKVVVDDLTNTLKEDEDARKMVVDDLTIKAGEDEAIFGSSSNIEQ